MQANPDTARAAMRRKLQRKYNEPCKQNASREISAPAPTQGRHICHLIWWMIALIMVDES
jgi:hypothetical protein